MDVFVLKSGWVKVSTAADGREQIIAVRGPGDIIGERAVRAMSARSATVTALDEVTASTLPADRFTEFLENHPIALVSIKHLDEDREAEDKLRRDSPESARKELHLADLILRTARRTGFDDRDDSAVISLPLTTEDLANWANATPGDVERYLRSWRRRGIVRHRGPQSLVIALARLRLHYDRALLRVRTSPSDRPLWQAFTDGVGGTFDLFGVTHRTRPLSALRTVLDEDAHALCLILGLAPEDKNSGLEGADR